jgi:hypothetical protein
VGQDVMVKENDINDVTLCESKLIYVFMTVFNKIITKRKKIKAGKNREYGYKERKYFCVIVQCLYLNLALF